MTEVSTQPRLRNVDAVERTHFTFESLLCTNTSNRSSSLEEKILDVILEKIDEDSLACDLLCSLFMSALNSYRCDTALRPFPAEYKSTSSAGSLSEDVKDFNKLKSVAQNFPCVIDFLRSQVDSSSGNDTSAKSFIHLLDWILNTKNFTLHSVLSDKFLEIKKLTGQTVDTPNPTHIFEIRHYGIPNERFQNKCDDTDLLYAYHGSSLDNFHSILRNGLQNHMNKNSVFGQGTYMSSEISVCLPYSTTGQSWDKSLLGKRISCVAVCEFINHPDVKCHKRKVGCSGNSSNLFSKSDHCFKGNIPEKYYLVQNDELVRVKYLLVYAEQPVSVSPRMANSLSLLKNWMRTNGFWIIMAVYLSVLFAIGLRNS